MSSFYFYISIIGFAVGIAAASLFTISFAYVVWMVVVAGVVGMIAKRGSEASSFSNLILGSLFLITCALGIIRFEFVSQDEMNPFYESYVDTEIVLEGIVVREPDIREKTTHLYVRVEDELILVKTHRYTTVFYGDLIYVEGILKKPAVFETDLGRTFNYPGYLHARGVSYTVSFAEVYTLEKDQGNFFISTILSAKKIFMQRIEAVLVEPQAGLAEGLLLGVKQALGDELETIFRKTGVIHIVVLSGYNVMLVVIFITYVLSYILPYRARAVFGVGAIICFAILVGLSATVVRASVMAALILLARSTGRTYEVLRALVFAGFIMVLLNPYLLIYDVGFQLSFLATLGLIFVVSSFEKKLKYIPALFGVRGFLAATVVTQIFVMPILLYNIGEFSIVSVLVNVLVLPMVPVAMLLTFVTGLVGFLSLQLSMLVGFAAHISLSYIVGVTTFFAEVPFASVAIPVFSFWVVPLCYLVMGYGVYWLQSRNTIATTVLPGWTLEDESDVRIRLQKEKSVVSLEDTTEQLPIFFR